jgi:hypothetical protein
MLLPRCFLANLLTVLQRYWLSRRSRRRACALTITGAYTCPTLLLSIGTRGRQSSSTRILMKTAGLKSSKFVINFKQRPSPLFPMARIY